jgi:hypothetical protein
MLKRQVLIIVVVALIAPVVSACGDDDEAKAPSQALTPRQVYVRQGDVICTRLKRELTPLRDAPADREAVAKAAAAVLPAFERAEASFKQMATPPGDSIPVLAFVSGFADQIVTLNNYRRGVQDDEEDLLRGSISQFPALARRQEQNAQRYGLKVCSDLGVADITLPG